MATETRLTKRCTKCRKRKQVRTGFYRSPLYHGGFTARCKKCTNKEIVKRRRENPESAASAARASAKYARTEKGHAMFKRHRVKHRETRRQYMAKWHKANPDKDKDYALRQKFGITLEQYNAMLKKQNGKCFICDKKCSTKRRLSVDHDHRTKRVRKLLCYLCNVMIGSARENPQILREAKRLHNFILLKYSMYRAWATQIVQATNRKNRFVGWIVTRQVWNVEMCFN